MTLTTKITTLTLHSPNGETLKQTRLNAGLNQVEAVNLMGYPVQPGALGKRWRAALMRATCLHRFLHSFSYSPVNIQN